MPRDTSRSYNAAGQFRIIPLLSHLRYRNRPHGCGRSHAGPRAGGKSGAADDGRHPQAGRKTRKPGSTDKINIFADAGLEGKMPHDDKKRHNHQQIACTLDIREHF